MKESMKEVDWRHFKAKHKKLGYNKKKIKARWEKATNAEAFRKGMARRSGNKVHVWLKQGRECAKSDIIQLEMLGEQEENFVNKEQSKKCFEGSTAWSCQLRPRQKFSEEQYFCWFVGFNVCWCLRLSSTHYYY